MAEAKSYVDTTVMELQAGKLDVLVQAQLENKDISEQTRAKLEEHTKEKHIGFRTQSDTFKLTLTEVYENYLEPTRSVADCISAYEEKRRAMTMEYVAQENRAIDLAKSQNLQYYPRPRPALPDYRDPFHRLGDRYYALDLDTGRVKDELLINPMIFTVSDVSSLIIVNSYDHRLHLLETLKNLLDFGQEVGMKLDQCMKLLKQIIREYASKEFGPLDFLKESRDIFDQVLRMVNFHTEMTGIRKAVNRIIREPGTPLEVTINEYVTLLIRAAKLEAPNMQATEATNKAYAQGLRTIDYVVEPNLKDRLKLYKSEKWSRLNTKVTLEDALQFCMNMEQQAEYALKSAKMLQNQPVQFSLYHTDTLNNFYDDSLEQDGFGPADEFLPPYEDDGGLGGLVDDFNHLSHQEQDYPYDENYSYDDGSYDPTAAQDCNAINSFGGAQYRSQMDRYKQGGRPYNLRPNKGPAPNYGPFVASHRPRGVPRGRPGGRARGYQGGNRGVGGARTRSPGHFHGFSSRDARNARDNRPASRSSTPEDLRPRQQPKVFYSEKGGWKTLDNNRIKQRGWKTFYRTASGNREFPMDVSRMQTLRPGSPNYRPYEVRYRSPSNERSQHNRYDDRGRSEYKPDKPDRVSCRMCGSHYHERPQSLSRLPSNFNPRHLCRYLNLPEQNTPCTVCNKQLYHPKSSCKEYNTNPAKKVNHLEAGQDHLNPDLN